MAENLGAYHLSSGNNAVQPVRVNNFRFVLDSNSPVVQNLIRSDGNQNPENPDYLKNVSETIELSVISFNPPHFKQEDIPIKRGNSTIYFAGVATFDENTLKINDFVGADGKSVLMAWQALSYDVMNDTIQTSDKYKIDATVYEYLPDDTLIRSWKLKGCWVKGLTEDEWNNENNGKKTVTATIRYDKAIPFYGE